MLSFREKIDNRRNDVGFSEFACSIWQVENSYPYKVLHDRIWNESPNRSAPLIIKRLGMLMVVDDSFATCKNIVDDVGKYIGHYRSVSAIRQTKNKI